MNDEQGSRLDEGLRRLRELGYLRGPGELYVARQLKDRQHSGLAALVVGVWTGGGAGAVIGLLLLFGALLIEPALLDRPAELAWLVFDFVGFCVLGGILVVTLTVWPFLRYVSSRPQLPTMRWQNLGALVPALPLALYVADALARTVLPQLEAARVPVAVAVCLLAGGVGSAVSYGVEGLLAVARVRVRGDWRPPRPRVGRRLADFAIITICAGLLVFVAKPGDGHPHKRLDQLELPAARGTKSLLLIGLDGIDVGELGEQSSFSPDLLSMLERAERVHLEGAATEPASFWNEIATGFSEAQHGLRSASRGAPHGVPGPISAIDRSPVLSLVVRVLLPWVGLGQWHATDQRELIRPQLWEIAAQAGLPSAAVNWWATYPAARHERLRVASDRWFLRLWESREDAAADSLLWSPPDLWARMLPTPDSDLLQRSFRFRAERRAVHGGDTLLAMIAEQLQDRDLVDAWSYATTADAFHALLTRNLCTDPTPPAFIALQLNGADILQRRLRVVLREAKDPTAAARIAVQLRSAQARFLAQLLRQLQDSFEGDILLLVAHSQDMDRERELRALWLRGEGRLPATLLDLAPLVLSRLGIPAAHDMAHSQDSPGPPSYGLRPDWTPAGGRHRIDLERLRSLGYIGQ